MSQPCAVSNCKQKVSTLCTCCEKKFCTEHLNEHMESNKLEFNSISDEIVKYNNDLKMLELDKLIKDNRHMLTEWRDDCYRTIACYYEEKCQELEHMYTQQLGQYRRELDQIQKVIINRTNNENFNENSPQSLKSTFNNLKQDIDIFKEKGVQIHIRPFKFDYHSISLKPFKLNAIHINPSLFSSPHHSIECMEGWQSELACNEQLILISISNNLCILNRDLILIKKAPWKFDFIYDVCWSSALSSFITVTEKKKVYRVHETTLLIERTYGIEEKDWLSCTCSDTCLYLTTREIGSNVFQFKLLPIIRLVKQWQPPYSCRPNESIHDIQYHEKTIALIIRECSAGTVDIELRSSATFSRLWSLPLDLTSVGLWSRISCCSLPHNEWLVTHSTTSRLFHISKDGKLNMTHEYSPKLNNAIVFDSNTLVIHLGKQIVFYKL